MGRHQQHNRGRQREQQGSQYAGTRGDFRARDRRPAGEPNQGRFGGTNAGHQENEHRESSQQQGNWGDSNEDWDENNAYQVRSRRGYEPEQGERYYDDFDGDQQEGFGGEYGQSWGGGQSSRRDNRTNVNSGYGSNYGGYSQSGSAGQGAYGSGSGFEDRGTMRSQGFGNQGNQGGRQSGHHPQGGGYGNQGYANQGFRAQGTWGGQSHGGGSSHSGQGSFSRGFTNHDYGNQTPSNRWADMGSQTRRSNGDWDIDTESWESTSDDWNERSGWNEPGREDENQDGARSGQRGRFTGRGPKGYTRSDERIAEDINEQLTQHGDIDPSDIEVQVNNSEVMLSGIVDSRESKRLAEDIAEQVSGVTEVINHIRVRREASRGSHIERS